MFMKNGQVRGIPIAVMLQVTEVVACLHGAGVVQRDIEPRAIAFTGGRGGGEDTKP